MHRDDRVEFVKAAGELPVHILIGTEEEHQCVALCGHRETFLNQPKRTDTWLFLCPDITVVSDLCVDCLEQAARIAKEVAG